jgi:hypothetical protein
MVEKRMLSMPFYEICINLVLNKNAEETVDPSSLWPCAQRSHSIPTRSTQWPQSVWRTESVRFISESKVGSTWEKLPSVPFMGPRVKHTPAPFHDGDEWKEQKKTSSAPSRAVVKIHSQHPPQGKRLKSSPQDCTPHEDIYSDNLYSTRNQSF